MKECWAGAVDDECFAALVSFCCAFSDGGEWVGLYIDACSLSRCIKYSARGDLHRICLHGPSISDRRLTCALLFFAAWLCFQLLLSRCTFRTVSSYRRLEHRQLINKPSLPRCFGKSSASGES